MKSRAEIKTLAKEGMRQKYWPSVGLLALALAIIGGCSWAAVLAPLAGSAAVFLVGMVITVGMVGIFVRLWNKEDFSIGGLFRPFSRYGRVLGGMMWQVLWLMVWSLIFIIPFTVFFTMAAVTSVPAMPHVGMMGMGMWRMESWMWMRHMVSNVFWVLAMCSFALLIPTVIKSYSYYMTQYILAAHPGVPAKQALELSKTMMNGHKGRLFVAQLSFLGWFLLCGLTFGVLYVFYVGPYYQAAMAGYFEEIKADALARNVVSEAELSGEARAAQ